VKPPVALPTDQPFLSIYTPTFRRPQQLAKLLESVARQTARADLEQLVFPDHVGYGIVGGLWGRIEWYADACRGRYATVIGDDDVIASDDGVAKLKAFAEKTGYPEVIVVRARKNGLDYPSRFALPFECGDIDLCCYVLRRDVWVRHKADYGKRYEGDYDHGMVLYNAGYRHEFLDMLWVDGHASHGRPEVDWH
jgi:glycosyltransferase involved in cell wall biosynthesis